MHYLWHRFINESLRTGTLPLWDGSLFCGAPFATGYTPHGNPVAFIAYLLLPLTVAHDVVLWVHLLAAGLFMYVFLKTIALNRIAALIGSVAWMFNGYVMVFFEIESAVIAAASLPASMYFFEKWLGTRSVLHAVLCAS